MGENLVDVTRLGVGNDRHEVKNDILGVHILSELERDLVLATRRNRGLDLDSGQVADNGAPGRSILGEGLGGLESTADVDNVNWSRLIVGDLNESLVDAVVDELHTKDIRVGEGGFDIGLELGGLGGSRNIRLGVGLEVDATLAFANLEAAMPIDSFARR